MKNWPLRMYADYCVTVLAVIALGLAWAGGVPELALVGAFLGLGYWTGRLTR